MKIQTLIVAAALALLTGITIIPDAFAEFDVYDANNQYLGILADDSIGSSYLNGRVRIFVPSLNKVITVLGDGNIWDERVYETRPWDQVQVYYGTEDCSGTPYIPETDPTYSSGLFNYSKPRYIKMFMDGCQQKIYLVGNPQAVTPLSYKIYECQQGPDQICQPYYDMWGVTAWYPLTEIAVIPPMESPFTLPIPIPLKFKQTTFDVNGDRKMGLEEGIFILQETTGVR